MEIIDMEELVNSHLKFIYRIMHSQGVYQGHHMYDDVVSAGKMGLIKSIATWDSKRYKLTTHSFHYIRKEIQTCLAQSDTIGYKCLSSKIHSKTRVYSLDFKYLNEFDSNFSMGNFLYKDREEDEKDCNKEKLQKVLKAMERCKLTRKQKVALQHLTETGYVTKKKNTNGVYKTTSATSILQKIRRHLKHV